MNTIFSICISLKRIFEITRDNEKLFDEIVISQLEITHYTYIRE